MTRKELIKAEIKRRSRLAEQCSTTETTFTRVHRLLGYLARPNPIWGKEGITEVSTIRAYYLKHDRKKYREFLESIKRQIPQMVLFNSGQPNLKYSFGRMDEFKVYADNGKGGRYNVWEMPLTVNILWQKVA